MKFSDNVLTPMTEALTSTLGWGICVVSIGLSATWLGLSLAVDRWVTPLETLFAIIFSPLLVLGSPMLLVVYIVIVAAWYLPAKIELPAAYVAAMLVIAGLALWQSWSIGEAAVLLIRLLDPTAEPEPMF